MNLKLVPALLFVFTFLALIPTLCHAATGMAFIAATSTNSTISGTARFEDTDDGLRVTVDVMNAPSGKHGLHIHEFGMCGDTGKAAGNHYNPLGSPHGNIMKDDAQHAHKGDLGNIAVGSDGKGFAEALIPDLTLSSGPFAVAGRSVIIHEKVDDFGQPLGNAGGRIGCGVIAVTGN